LQFFKFFNQQTQEADMLGPQKTRRANRHDGIQRSSAENGRRNLIANGINAAKDGLYKYFLTYGNWTGVIFLREKLPPRAIFLAK
jgi:hypothetical protein